MQHNAVKTAALYGLRNLGYHDDLIVDDWSPRELLPGRDDGLNISTVAFWARPFDQFRSAVSVVDRNGAPDYQIARQVASKVWSHVAVCGDSDMSLWSFEADDVHKIGDNIAVEAIPRVFQEHESKLNRLSVAGQKMRLRQYALYETDPNGTAFAEWAINPSAEQAETAFATLMSTLVSGAEPQLVNRHRSPEEMANLAGWIFRVLVLRVGIDREWEISQGISREDVRSIVERAIVYPTELDIRTIGIASSEASTLAERTLELLRYYDFSTIDPILVIRAFNSPSLRKIRSGLELFPTPGPIAWDIVSSIPIQPGQMVCDPTAGTGTFLVTAGLNLWASAGPDGNVAELLRATLVGGDLSKLAADLMRMSLDLVFGWDEQEWRVKSETVEETLRGLDQNQELVLLGNLPWSAAGRSENEASRILQMYINALKNRASGWLGTITPKSIWTKRDRFGEEIRSSIREDFSLEEVWELNWNAIKGGRSQALATVMSRTATSRTVTTWKRQDNEGAFRLIGYLTGGRNAVRSGGLKSPDAEYFAERLEQFERLESILNVRHGLQPKNREILEDFQKRLPDSDGVRFVRNWKDFQSALSSASRICLPKTIVSDDRAVSRLFHRPQRAYRESYDVLPQLVLTRHIYEGLHRFRVDVIDQPTLFSDGFLICIPKFDGVPEQQIEGIAVALNSVFGRVWLYLNAWAGRDLSISGLEQFPVPSVSALSALAEHYADGENESADLGRGFDWEMERHVCFLYGLSDRETTVILGIGGMLGLAPAIPDNLLPTDDLKEVIDDISGKLSELVEGGIENMTPFQRDEAIELWNASLLADAEIENLILSGTFAQVAIEKSAIIQKI